MGANFHGCRMVTNVGLVVQMIDTCHREAASLAICKLGVRKLLRAALYGSAYYTTRVPEFRQCSYRVAMYTLTTSCRTFHIV